MIAKHECLNKCSRESSGNEFDIYLSFQWFRVSRAQEVILLALRPEIFCLFKLSSYRADGVQERNISLGKFPQRVVIIPFYRLVGREKMKIQIIRGKNNPDDPLLGAYICRVKV